MPYSFFNYIIFLLLFLASCSDNPVVTPPPPNADDQVKNTITIETVWIELKAIALKITSSAEDTAYDFSYRLKRKDETGVEKTIPLNTLIKDTTFIDNNEGVGLTPGKTYSYKVEAKGTQNELKDTSRTLNVKTLSPTSHSYSWQVDTLGQAGNILKDVWGLDENNVWAVGYVNLSSGPTGIIKWDGNKWNAFPASSGVKYGIFGFNSSYIIVVGESINRGFSAIWDGNFWQEFNSDYFYSRGDTVYQLQSVWGSSPENVWAVGFFGTIIHWDGTEWTKVSNIDSKYNFWDVWGIENNLVYAVGNKSSDEMAIYKYDGVLWEKIFTDNINGSRTSSVWCANPQRIYITDYNNYVISYGQLIELMIPVQKSVIERIRGGGPNNIFTVGHFGDVMHYNGEEWASEDELYTYPNSRLLEGVWVFENKVFIVGYTGDSGVIAIVGEKNN